MKKTTLVESPRNMLELDKLLTPTWGEKVATFNIDLSYFCFKEKFYMNVEGVKKKSPSSQNV
jgi:hypothetical protein